MEIQKVIKPFKCLWGSCQIVFESPNDCFYHCRKSHVKKEMKTCLWNKCHMVSSSRCNLTNHLLTHIPVVSGVCYVCDREFKWRWDFKKHIRRHSATENRFNEAAAILFVEYHSRFEF